ncbi:MAG: hypothetical protein CBB68_07215 [Rhodospirillaceae bacterium TMED8]|nr:hypothetical protein [Magnetovibrio sp.]OUT50780.1 MAG: hypothetical protein CBB68_07215 [Rhodospirillaceae bacterium TMED8]
MSRSDNGQRLAAQLVYNQDGTLSGITNTHLDTLSNKRGRPLKHKTNQDAGSMSLGDDGEIIVAFERNHRIWRYLPEKTGPMPIKPPTELASMPSNEGIEALTLLNDGSLLAISEGDIGGNEAVAWVSDTSGWSVMTFNLSGGFEVLGAASLPSGDVPVLKRRFTV